MLLSDLSMDSGQSIVESVYPEEARPAEGGRLRQHEVVFILRHADRCRTIVKHRQQVIVGGMVCQQRDSSVVRILSIGSDYSCSLNPKRGEEAYVPYPICPFFKLPG